MCTQLSDKSEGESKIQVSESQYGKEKIMSSSRWGLKCRIHQGMFDDEYLITIPILDENNETVEASAFVDREELVAATGTFPEESQAVDGRLKVSPIEVRGERAYIVLPKPTLANGHIVSVRKSDLKQLEGTSSA